MESSVTEADNTAQTTTSERGSGKPAKQRRGFQLPHIYVILFGLSALAALATYLVPATEYERVPGPDGREVVDPDQYGEVESASTTFVEFITAVPRGLVDAGEVVFFTFIIGGVFMVLRRSGIIETALDKLLRSFSKRRIVLIPLLMTIFAALATLIGTQELSLVYIPVLLPVIIALGYDSITAAAIALVGTTAGFTAGVLNPINTGLSQQISGLETFSGAGLRAVLLVVLITLGAAWTMRYASKVSADPTYSYIYGDASEAEKRELYADQTPEEPRRMTMRQRIALLLAAPVLGVTVWGVMTQGWFMIEMAGMFILVMLVIGLVSGLRPTELCNSFSEGMRSVLEAAVIVGVARSVAVILEDGRILDTMVHGLSVMVGGLPAELSAVGMFIVQGAFNFVVPSGSGQAVVTMPVMAPLADLVGVTRQTAVLAFQLGDGLPNLIYPTSGYFMAALAIAGVRWEKWVKFYLPLLGMWIIVALGFLIFAQAIGWTG